MDKFYMKTSCFLYLMLFLFIIGWNKEGVAQDKKIQDSNIDSIEIRKVKRKSDGSVMNGAIPDSLNGKFFAHENGKLYKHFHYLEAVIAHYRGGYHPRGKEGVETGVVYISKAPSTDKGEFPFSMAVGQKND